jgi:large subunit ribosomal protein L17
MLRNMATSLFKHGKITTTETKAKRLRPLAERLVTFAKRGDLASRRRVIAQLTERSVVHELFTNIAPQVADRQGGYTRITKLGFRKGDNAPMALIELVLEPVNSKPKANKTKLSNAVKAGAAVAVADAAVEEEVSTEVAEEAAVVETEAAVEAPAEAEAAVEAEATEAVAEEAAAEETKAE